MNVRRLLWNVVGAVVLAAVWAAWVLLWGWQLVLMLGVGLVVLTVVVGVVTWIVTAVREGKEAEERWDGR